MSLKIGTKSTRIIVVVGRIIPIVEIRNSSSTERERKYPIGTKIRAIEERQ